MRAVDWMRDKPIRAAACAGLLAGIGAGLLWPVTVPRADAQAEPSWNMPRGVAALRPTEKEFAAVRDSAAWGATGPGAEASKRPSWRLAGIIAEPAPAALILVQGEQEPRRLGVGQQLPDGSAVKEIGDDAIRFDRDGCLYELALYTIVETAVPGCPAAGPSPGKAK